MNRDVYESTYRKHLEQRDEVWMQRVTDAICELDEELYRLSQIVSDNSDDNDSYFERTEKELRELKARLKKCEQVADD